jgi:hypothetical protein
LQVISFIYDVPLHCFEFETITSEYDFDIDNLGINIDFSELIGAECIVPELIAINLEFLDCISDIECLSATDVGIERACIIFRDLIGATAACHHSLVTRHLVRLIAAISCEILSKRFAKDTSIIDTRGLAFEC